ncbi:unnamed protein product [Rhizophagus irregularis]|nr:unnamed protein product [Rhizophagus irregularis]CAB5350167.1 unnamed protein product [Rhizophagus irregularis]
MSTVQNLNSIQNFLNNLNYNNINLYPFNNDPLKVAIHVRNFTEIQVLTATNDIWNLHLTDLQKNQFTDLADKANRINQDFVQTNEDTLNRIYQIDLLQGANTPLENHIFNGVAF